jgi:hypothetical protein
MKRIQGILTLVINQVGKRDSATLQVLVDIASNTKSGPAIGTHLRDLENKIRNKGQKGFPDIP